MSRSLKIAVVQFNPVVGAVEDNCARMLTFYRKADAEGVDLVIFPEMATTGYPIEDLALSGPFVRNALKHQQELMSNISLAKSQAGVLFGAIGVGDDGSLKASNTAILYDPVENKHSFTTKYELPNYGVFDEKRVFVQNDIEKTWSLRFRGTSLGVMICEDCWFPTVTEKLIGRGADILIALNGSPFEDGKDRVRYSVVNQRILESAVYVSDVDGDRALPFLYVNLVGGQDELVFDGGSFAITQAGVKQMAFFKETTEYVTITLGRQSINHPEYVSEEIDNIEAIYSACVLGLRDYMIKQGFKSVTLGMSGGVDSGIVAAIACDAIGPENVHLVRLPSKYSSDGSLHDAARAAISLGAPIRTINIEPVVNALRTVYSSAEPATPVINPLVNEWGKGLTGVADENIQARARGNILMAISNQEGHLLLTTGNKSEVSVGYSTLYGDMAGGFNPIKDCYKTTVWAMCHYRNSLNVYDLLRLRFLGAVGDMVPDEIITKPPSAELRPDQQDSDSLPPYEVLDRILKGLIEEQDSVTGVFDDMIYDGIKDFDINTVRKIRWLVDRAEYKRRQAAPGIKLTSKLHGRERRYPIVNKFSGESTSSNDPTNAAGDDSAPVSPFNETITEDQSVLAE